MSYAATAASTTTNAHATTAMNTPYYQGGHPQGQAGQQGQQQPPNGAGQPSPYAGFPQQAFNPQQQQFAHWAYQQMMFQQQQLGFQPQGPVPHNPYLTTQQQQALQLQLFQQQQQQQFLMQQQQQQQAAAATAAAQHHHFPQPPQLPYARENNSSKSSLHSERGGSRSRTNSSNAAGDTASKARARTTSGRSSKTAPAHSGGVGHHGRSTTGSESGSRSRGASGSSSPAPSQPPLPRHPGPSISSTGSPGAAPPGAARPPTSHSSSEASSVQSNGPLPSPTSAVPSPAGSAANIKVVRPPGKPSPLSQGSSSSAQAPGPVKPTIKEAQPPAQKSYANAVAGETPTAVMQKSGGLKGRLRRALSFSVLDEAGKPEDDKLGSRRQVVNAKLASEGQQSASSPRSPAHVPSASHSTISLQASSSSTKVASPVAHVPAEGSIRSTVTAQQPPKKRSLFNAKFNRSTDNMSLSSTVSSASLMIRKLGSVGKLVRRNSLMGISNMFKDKDKNKAGSDGEDAAVGQKKKEKGKKMGKAGKAEASVSHATVEVERGAHSPSSSGGSPSQDDMVGLSPAAKLARQHTLRSRAAEAAKAKVAGDAAGTPSTWEKNTATRSTLSPGAQRKSVVGEFGGALGGDSQQQWTPSDDDLSDEEGTVDGKGSTRASQPGQVEWRDPLTMDDSDEEEQEDSPYEDEDDTVRIGGQDESELDHDEQWAVGIRRSVERTRVPTKGILKNASSYERSQLGGPPQAPFSRVRTNSNDSAPPMGAEPGPLARIPSPDPDHIDGLHRSDSGSVRHAANHHRALSTSSSSTTLIPPLSFDSSDTASLGSFLSGGSTVKERPNSVYSNADFNASAPTLGTHNSEQTSLQMDRAHPAMPNLSVLRSATTPLAKSKKLTYAANLSVYHTFSPVAYDRRSEPATCNRLTPALAQRIKEELNSYKMEEMEVHPSSRQHTHFFV